jgi:hypothetical protein
MYPTSAALVPYMLIGYPILLYAATTLYPQIIGCLLLLATLLLLSTPGRSPGHLLSAGLVYGCLCLAIPAFLYMTPILLAYLVLERRRPWRFSFGAAGGFVLVVILTIAPWTIRNRIEFHAFIPISANGGFNLLVGNSATTPVTGKPSIEALRIECPALLDDSDEVALDKALTRCAMNWITANPGTAARLYAAKLLNYFNFRNELTTANQQKWWEDWIAFATYYPLLVVALLRLALFRQYRLTAVEWLLYALYFGNAVLTAVFFTNLRFRIPYDVLLIAIDAAFLARFFSPPRRVNA